MRYAIISGNSVVNVVDYDDLPTTPPPGMDEGFAAIASDVAGPGWTYASGVFTDPTPRPSLTAMDVNAERDRRLRRFTFEGREYDYIDGKGSDQKIAKRGNIAAVAVITGEGWPEGFEWIAADNSKVPMDAKTFLNFSKAGADWEDRIMHAARRLKDMSPIPADFTDDSRW